MISKFISKETKLLIENHKNKEKRLIQISKDVYCDAIINEELPKVNIGLNLFVSLNNDEYKEFLPSVNEFLTLKINNIKKEWMYIENQRKVFNENIALYKDKLN